jgi:hypothetical protein
VSYTCRFASNHDCAVPQWLRMWACGCVGERFCEPFSPSHAHPTHSLDSHPPTTHTPWQRALRFCRLCVPGCACVHPAARRRGVLWPHTHCWCGKLPLLPRRVHGTMGPPKHLGCECKRLLSDGGDDPRACVGACCGASVRASERSESFFHSHRDFCV